MDRVPITTVILCLMTITMSLTAAYQINHVFFGSVRISDLEMFGGFTLSHIKNFELWRLFVAQLIHSKQMHMFYNVLALLCLGICLEKKIGVRWFLTVWFVSGAFGTLYSTFFVVPPWNLGTGGSQAIFGLSGFASILLPRIEAKRNVAFALIFSMVPALSLDLIFAGYPKPGHLAGFTIGMLFGIAYLMSVAEKEN